MSDPYRYFRIEAREVVGELGEGVAALESGAPASEIVAKLLRLAHTLKGAARVVKRPEIADQAHVLEDVLEPIRESQEPVPGDRLDQLTAVVGNIRDRVGELPPPPEVVAASGRPRVDEGLRTIRSDVTELDELLEEIGETYAELGPVRDGLSMIERAHHLADLLAQQLTHRRNSIQYHAKEADGERVRHIASELREVTDAVERVLTKSVDRVDRRLRQVKATAERLRLETVTALFADTERAALDVAEAQGKRIIFEGIGGEVRLDAHVVAAVQPALHQLVRNAVAHGIEPEAERRAAGKQPEGLITLAVARRGRQVIFTCRDDGQGVDLEAVRSAVRRKGLLTTETERLGPDELLRLLLRGGISTSGTVTEVSGRGIGLDVVRESVRHLGGEIAVVTDRGVGTTVRLEIPLSVAALDVLVVEAEGITAAIPLDAVRGAVWVPSAEVAPSPEGTSLVYEESPVPFLPLADAFAVKSSPMRGRGSGSVAIIEGANGMAAIGVQRLLGKSSVVIRPLPDQALAGGVVSGVWLDNDGNPQLVLDANALVNAALRHEGEVSAEQPSLPILVIDDSLTTRMLELGILETAGYEVQAVSSAEDALERAQHTRFGLFLVDIELPEMDGFAFVEHTRESPTLSSIPCIIITSRASPTDRKRGLEAGAHAYIAKGEFDQTEFLDLVRELVGG